MSDLITDEIFTDGQQQIAASNMNNIVGRARIQPDAIGNKVASATMDVADQFMVLKTDNTLARARFDTIVNSTSSTLPVADSTKNGMLRQLSGNATDYVGGDNQCHQLIPTGTVWDTLASTPPVGWLILDGSSYLRTDYPNLFALIGTAYGSVDGTHFNVPDARGRATIGAGGGPGLTYRALGSSVGAENTVLSVANLPSHNHSITDVAHTHVYTALNNAGSGFATGTGASWFSQSTNAANTGITGTNYTGSGAGVPIVQPGLVVNKMVKT